MSSINGKIEVYNRCLEDDGLEQLYRAQQLLAHALQPDAEYQRGRSGRMPPRGKLFGRCRKRSRCAAWTFVAGTLSLMDFCTEGPQFASGGYIADTRAETVLNGSQQQWLTRNSEVGEWTNGVWNQVFAGVVGAPDDAGFPGYDDEGVPQLPYTTLETTPVSREKPYLFLDEAGDYKVRVPSAQRETRGVSWNEAMTAGTHAGVGGILRRHAFRLGGHDQRPVSAGASPLPDRRASMRSLRPSKSSTPIPLC